MKRIVIILIIGFVFSSLHAQMNNPLKAGMPNTVKLPSGEVIYDLNGEWDAVYDTGGWGVHQVVVRFTQNENQFLGIVLNDIRHLSKNEEAFKGKLRKNSIEEIYFYDSREFATMNQFWAPSEGTIVKDGNIIEIIRIFEIKGSTIKRTWKLKRK